MNRVAISDTLSEASSTAQRHDIAPAPPGSAAIAIARAGASVRKAERCSPNRVAAALGRTAELWRKRDFAPRRDTVASLAAALGHSSPLLDESLDALLEPVVIPALKSLASRLPAINRLFGFVMPGNVPGAGIHEICAVLLSGAGAVIKSASSEPLFFPKFVRTLAEVDAAVAAHAAVVNFARDNDAATHELWAVCDGGVVAYGDDASVAALGAAENRARAARRFLGFGSRLSGALVVAGASPSAAAAADGLARDVTLFEQRGCLSPHHVFVLGGAGEARGFAARLARALERLEHRLPAPAHLPLGAAAAIRELRERARWRALTQLPSGREDCDCAIALWEGDRLDRSSAGSLARASDGMTWTVIYDPGASFCPSPGYRTVFVGALQSADELGERLNVATGRLEGFALSAPLENRARLEAGLRRLGVSYVCEPGRMQSPPLNWPHGDDAMLKLLREAAR